MKKPFFYLLFYFCIFGSATAQNVDYSTPLYTNQTFSKTVNPALPVGSVPGAAAVSGTGGASYTIPIAVPPGTNGVVPAISVAYNSQAGNGAVGNGWGISGLSMVSRSGQSMYFDGKVTAIDLSNQDRFVLDGQMLLSVNGAYGANGSTYASEQQNFAVVTSNGISGTGPTWFKVVTKDGIEMEFGNTADSRCLDEANLNVLFWRVNRIRNPDGNYIDFKYLFTDRDSRIDEINYTGNTVTGLAPYNKLKFEYKIRGDINTQYLAGSTITNKYLLDKITVTAEGSVTKTYQFNYSWDNITSYLREIVESGTNGAALNSTIFKYGQMPDPFASGIVGTTNPNTSTHFFGDFNGDGKTDILGANSVNSGVPYVNYTDSLYLHLSQPNTSTLLAGPKIKIGPNYSVIREQKIPNNYHILAGDYTGDGIDDFITLKVTNIGSDYKLDSVIIYESANAGFSFIKHLRSIQPNFFRIHPKGNFFFPGDFDGDGITEYIAIVGNTLNNYAPFLCTNYIQGGSCGSVSISGPTGFPIADWAAADKIYVLDFNGDGKSDLMLIKDNLCEIFTLDASVARRIYSSNFPTKNHLVYFGDFNGDSKTDLLTRASLTDNAALWTTAFATGYTYQPNTFTWAQIPNITNEYYKNHHVNLGDFNGDGKTDIYHGKNNANLTASKLDVYYSRGLTFHNIQSDHSKTVSNWDSFTADLDGDSRMEVLSVEFFSDPPNQFFFKPNGKENLIHKVANGNGHINTWYYKTLSSGGGFYTKGSGTNYPFNGVQPPIYTVFQHVIQNGIGANHTQEYSYEEARFHRAGKGSLGFKKVIASNLTSGIKSVSENEFNTNYYTAVPIKSGTYWTSGNALISETTLVNEFIPQGPAGSKRFLYRVKSSTENNAFEGRTLTVNNNTFDNFGNITQSTANNNNIETTVTTTVYGAYPGTIPNKPTSVTVNKTRSGQAAFSVTTGMGYNNLGQLTSKNDFGGLPKNVSTVYEYFPLGNLKKATVTPSGLPVRFTSAAYDAKGRFAQTTVNELGQTSTASYDPKWGLPLTMTGTDGLTTSFIYDAFGRMATTTYPEGYTVTDSYGWDLANGAIWFKLTTHPGKPDVKTWYDILDREIKSQTEAFPSGWTTQTRAYDARGNVATYTQPYKQGEPILTTTNAYNATDPYNRLVSVSNALTSTAYSYTYNAGLLSTSSTSAGLTSSTSTDATGKVVTATDNGGTLAYTYFSHGGLKEVSKNGLVLTSNQYDAYGRQTSLSDANAGTTTYDYNALGQLASQTNANNKTHTMQYDLLGRNTVRIGPEGTTTNEYYPSASGAATNQLKKVTGFAGNLEEYSYDNFGRLQLAKETVDGSIYQTSYGYNAYGDVTATTYPSGFGTVHAYDANGYPTTVKNGNSSVTLYTNTDMNGLGQNTAYTLGNGKASTRTYNYGIPTQFTTAGVQNLELTWDYSKGNLTKRKDYIKNKEESFAYDNLNRLLTATVTGKPVQTVTYEASGNISSKSDAGQQFSYHPVKSNALTGIISPTLALPTLTQDITYTPFNQPEKITENGSGQPYELTYTYDAGYQRLKGVMKKNGALINTHYYFGSYEKDLTPGLADKHLHYISTPAGLSALVIRENGADQYYYTYTDHLGSLLSLTAPNGTVLLDQNFDAWGRLRHPANWDYTNVPAPTAYLYRGFTGHEHLTNFNLINMNGRMYDPVVGRVLSVDNYVQDLYGTQDYNRYSYAKNNPLVNSDPDGEWINFVIGAVIGGFSGYQIGKSEGASGWDLLPYILGGAAVGTLSAGFGSAVTASVGSSVAVGYGGLLGAGIGGAVAGATSGVGFAAISGGNIGKGAWTGAVSGLTGGTVGASLGGRLGAFAGGAASGATGAALNGGNFKSIGLSALLSGGISYGSYQLQAAINYNKYRETGGILSRRQFNVVSHSAQKSFTRGREYGGWLIDDGSVEMFPRGSKAYIDPQPKPLGATGSFHTHPNTGGTWHEIHSDADIFFNNNNSKLPSIVIGRQNIFFHSPFQNPSLLYNNQILNPYPFSHYPLNNQKP
jgi:RHS repeat-associated protein